MTAEIISLDDYRKGKLVEQNKPIVSKSRNKSEVSKGVTLQTGSEQLHNIDNGDPI